MNYKNPDFLKFCTNYKLQIFFFFYISTNHLMSYLETIKSSFFFFFFNLHNQSMQNSVQVLLNILTILSHVPYTKQMPQIKWQYNTFWAKNLHQISKR